VVHCRTQAQAEVVMRSIAARLEESGLTMHPAKSKIVYCKNGRRTKAYVNVKFTFLGFTFRARGAWRKPNPRFTGFLPAVSNDALKKMRRVVRGWRIHRRTSTTLDQLAQQYNPVIRGWWNTQAGTYRSDTGRMKTVSEAVGIPCFSGEGGCQWITLMARAVIYPTPSEILAGTRAIAVDTGLRLSYYFGTSDEFWTDLEWIMTLLGLRTNLRRSSRKFNTWSLALINKIVNSSI
jgi:plasmid maintenance system antidote protein VapI